MKRSQVGLALALALLVMGSTAALAGGQAEPAGPVKVVFWCPLGGGFGEIIKAMEVQFTAEFPNITIDHQYPGDYYETQQKMLAAVAAGSPPDATLVMDASLPMINNSQALADLTPYISGKKGSYPIDYSDFIEGFMFITEWKGGKFALPFNKSTPLMFYNAEMLKKAGIAAPDPGYTWQELDAAAEKLTVRKGADVEVYGFEMPISVWFWEALMWGNGGEYVNKEKTKSLVNAREGLEVLEWWVDMAAKRKIMKQPPGRRYAAWDVMRSDFIMRKAAMLFDSTGAMGGYEGKVPYGAAFLPKKKAFATPYGGTFLAVLNKIPDDRKAAAYTFIAWMTDKERTIDFSQKTGYMPVRRSAVNADRMLEYYETHPYFKTAVDQLQYARGNPLLVSIFEGRELVDEALIAAVLEEMSPRDALDNAAKQFDALLAKEPR